MTSNTINFYKPWFDKWQADLDGPKPTQAMFDIVHGLGCRPGKQALAIAMSLRPGGVTRPQVIHVTGAPQFNKMGDLVKAKWLVDRNLPPTNDGRAHYVYGNEVTAAGKAEIAKRATAAAAQAAPKVKPAPKAKAKAAAKPKASKPKAPKVKPAKPEASKPEVTPSAPVEPAAPEAPATVN